MAVLEDVGLFQAMVGHQSLIGEEVKRRAVGNNQSRVQEYCPRAKPHDQLKIVRGDDFRAGQRLQDTGSYFSSLPV